MRTADPDSVGIWRSLRTLGSYSFTEVVWPEAFSQGYDERTAAVTADIGFYVGLAREADGPVVELGIGSAHDCGRCAAG